MRKRYHVLAVFGELDHRITYRLCEELQEATDIGIAYAQNLDQLAEGLMKYHDAVFIADGRDEPYGHGPYYGA